MGEQRAGAIFLSNGSCCSEKLVNLELILV